MSLLKYAFYRPIRVRGLFCCFILNPYWFFFVSWGKQTWGNKQVGPICEKQNIGSLQLYSVLMTWYETSGINLPSLTKGRLFQRSLN